MAALQEIRQQYPQYADLSDRDLADRLYARHYSDMPRAEFDRRVGLEPQSWGDYARGLGRAALQGLTFDFADEAGLVDREADKRFSEENPVASTVARIAGGAPLFVAGPGAAAARWAISGGRMLPNIGRSATLGSGLGTVSGLGAGEGDLAERLPSAQMGGLLGLGLGAAAPPVAAGVGRLAGAVAPIAERLTGAMRRPAEPPLPQLRPPPVEGATFVNEMAPGELANAQTRALQLIRDTLLRSGRTPDEVEAALARLQEARTYHTEGAAQDVLAIGDLDQGLQRLLGTLARQSPEAAQDIAQFLGARQTGLTPPGADAQRLAQRGLPTQQLYAEPLKAGSPSRPGPAERTLGSTFGAGGGNLVPMGHRARILDALKRTFRLKDSDFHGHAADAGRTQEQLAASMKTGAQRRYGALYRLGERVDLRPAVAPVIERWAARAEAAQPPLSDALRRAVRLFQQRDGQVVRDIKNFDLYGKQYLDDEISKAFRAGDNAIGRELMALRDDLFAALNNSTDRNITRIAALYRGARGEYSDNMRVQGIIERYRGAWDGDPRALIEDFASLSDAEKKLARLAVLWGAEQRTAGADPARNITALFRTPRAQQLLSVVIERSDKSGARFANRPERFGGFVDFERMLPETRNAATGGSMTARNTQDDLMTMALEASQNVRSFVNSFRGNQSLYQLGERLLTWAWDRSFGVGADAAREAVRMLLTANPAERTAILQRLAAITPADRMARFNELMARLQQTIAAPGIAGVAGAAGAPTPQPQGGPTLL